MKTLKLLLVLFIGISAFQSTFAQQNFAKKRVAVFNFENKTGNRSPVYGQRTVGEEVSDMIITELVKSNKFRVIEREQLDALLKEQDLGRSGIMTPESAAAIGKVLGVELAVFGAVTEMGHKKGDKGLKVKGVNLGMGKSSAVVAIDIRIVNTSTGEIVSAENIRKTKSGISGGVSFKNFNFNDRDQFDNSIVGKATRAAVDEVVALLSSSAANVPWSAKVITMNNGKVYINSGKSDGITVGSSMKVYRQGEELIDPDTGLNLGSVEQVVGTIKVIDNSVGEGKASICTVEAGDGFSKGDIVRFK